MNQTVTEAEIRILGVRLSLRATLTVSGRPVERSYNESTERRVRRSECLEDNESVDAVRRYANLCALADNACVPLLATNPSGHARCVLRHIVYSKIAVEFSLLNLVLRRSA